MSSDPGARLGAELLTLRFDPAADAFDDAPLRTRLAEVHLLSLREHFFTAGGVAHVACLLTYRAAAAPDTTKRAPPPLPPSAQPLYETWRRCRSDRARRGRARLPLPHQVAPRPPQRQPRVSPRQLDATPELRSRQRADAGAVRRDEPLRGPRWSTVTGETGCARRGS
ncbi:MAG: hypothetical protein AAF628_19590 [Planctomycetota bacterium]